MDAASILGLDQTKLVNAASAAVSQYERACLQYPIITIFESCYGQAGRRCADTGRGDRSHRDLLSVLEQLGLASTGLTDHEHVNLTSDAWIISCLLRHASD